MKKALLVIALVLTLGLVGAHTPTITLIQPGDSGKMLVPNGWNVNAGNLEEKVNLALALNKQGCYSSGYYVFQHDRECLLWLSFPVYANETLYLDRTQVKLIGFLRVYGATRQVVVKKIAFGDNQWLEFIDESTSTGSNTTSPKHYAYVYKPSQTPRRSNTTSPKHYAYVYKPSQTPRRSNTTSPKHYAYVYKPSQTPRRSNTTSPKHYAYVYKPSQTSRHYSYLTTSSYHPSNANKTNHASYSSSGSQGITRHYSHYSRASSKTAIGHYAYYSRSRQAIKAGNSYSRYYHRTGQNWLARRFV